MSKIELGIEAWLWRKRQGRSARVVFCIARYAWALIEDLIAGDLGLRSTSLVYTTILATVPLLAFSFAILKGLGLQQDLEPLIENALGPLGSQADELTSRIIGFVNNVSSSGLASISLLALVLAAFFMAQKVEVSINFTWNVDKPRSLVSRFTDYLSFMLIGPIFMSTAIGVIAAVNSTTFMGHLRAVEPLGEWLAEISKVTPYLLVIVGFSVLYKIVPNTRRVRFRAAGIGGLAAGVAWAAAGTVFAALVVSASRYTLIYSGFAIVIVTMLWLNISWLILLLGAQLAFYVQNPDYLRRATRIIELSPALGERLALTVMLIVGRAFDERQPGLDTEQLAAKIKLPRHFIEPIVSDLMKHRLLVEALEGRLVPGDDLHKITLDEILGAVRALDRHGDEHAAGPAVERLTTRAETAARAALDNRSLADLIAEARQANSPDGADRPAPPAPPEPLQTPDARAAPLKPPSGDAQGSEASEPSRAAKRSESIFRRR